jgi:protein O-GlcNAc transferase
MQTTIPQSQQILARAFAAHQAGNIAQAEFLYKMALQADKKQFDALHMLGLIEAQRGNFAAGFTRIRDALRVRPNAPEALINFGRIQSELGDQAAAIATYKKALAADPKSAVAHSNLSILLGKEGQREAALGHCDTALNLAPDYADAWNNRGNALFDLKRYTEAMLSYDRALGLQPGLVESHLGRGNVFRRLERYEEALAAYNQAAAVAPRYVDAHLGCGDVLFQLLRMKEALVAYERANAIEPENAAAWFGRGLTLSRLQREPEAFAAHDKAFRIKPDLSYLEGARLSAKMTVCDWRDLAAECAHLVGEIRQGALRCDPFRFLAVSTSAADQMTCARSFVADRFPASQPLWCSERYRHDRIRIGYLSPDLRHHAVAYLAAGMFEAHDRSRFETTALSFGPASRDDMQLRLRTAFDRFLDVGRQTDADIARIVRELEIDIAVDLSGVTENSRAAVLAQRGAPVQVNFLGYAGTTGAPYMDYIVADRTVIPPEHASSYAERIVTLPDTFMPSDSKRCIAERVPTRTECGLPENGFVFCCFNNAYKLTPEIFDVWMGLLKAVEGSVLWLGNLNAEAKANLCREAEARGIVPTRLIFASRAAEIADHLARQRLADLFLDASPYNAHTTANDALWAGVPVLTHLGSTFAGRVAASLVRAVGLAELVTQSLTDYQALALKLAREPELLSSIRAKLARNRETFPLFDTARFTRNIETAYVTMWERVQRGEPPESFAVNPS